VANSRGYGSGFRVDILWQIIFICVAVYIFILAPFSLFYYEGEDEDDKGSQCFHAIKMELFVIVIVVVLFVATFFFFADASIPIKQVTIQTTSLVSSLNEVSSQTNGVSGSLTLSVSFPIYVIAVFGWFGWWFFVIYAGVGITALPMDLIIEYMERPIRMKESEFKNARDTLVRELVDLKKMGEDIKVNDAVARRTTGCNSFEVSNKSIRVGLKKRKRKSKRRHKANGSVSTGSREKIRSTQNSG
jgi:LMBR1 domain-containing protein 1